MEQHQCKELHEAAIALSSLAGYVAKRAKDGIGLDDAGAIAAKLFTDEGFRDKLVAGITGIQNVPTEIAEEIKIDGIPGAIREFGTVISVAVSEFQKEYNS